ncbi:hypothetical protein CP973_10460 [Streptomyces albofaciens JCM 4342]|nr:hypothetical protein CP973_10460 [Streptomyces albofaciens JCM 4342]
MPWKERLSAGTEAVQDDGPEVMRAQLDRLLREIDPPCAAEPYTETPPRTSCERPAHSGAALHSGRTADRRQGGCRQCGASTSRRGPLPR